MNILAVDSCKENVLSIAVLKNEKIILSEIVEGRFSEFFFPILLNKKQIFDEIEVFAVNIGPGSYTGIRAAIAALSGMSLHGKRRLVGFDSFAVMLDKFRRNNQKLLRPEDAISVVLRGYNDSFCYLKEFNGNFAEQTKPVRIPSDSLKKIDADILLTDIRGYGDFQGISAEDLGLLALREIHSIREVPTVIPLYM